MELRACLDVWALRPISNTVHLLQLLSLAPIEASFGDNKIWGGPIGFGTF